MAGLNLSKSNQRMNLVVIGGGYSGIAALITIKRHLPDAEITLIDPGTHHLKITRLHETVRRPLKEITVPFSLLASRFGFTHLRYRLDIDEATLAQWQINRSVAVDGKEIGFDYLLVATGSSANTGEKDATVFDLNDLAHRECSDILEQSFARAPGEALNISVIGCGATGIQFAFEIAHVLKARYLSGRVTLVDLDEVVLKQFPGTFNRYAQLRMAEMNIQYVPNKRYYGKTGENIILEDRISREKSERESDLTFLFLGKTPSNLLKTNSIGQVLVGGDALDNIFAAGDCTHFNSIGSNLLTAQSALRKGRSVAKTILRSAGVVSFSLPYIHQDLGYIVSMGPSDGIGWIGLKGITVTGLPAFLLKELVENQYDLLISGMDTYLL